MAINLWFWYFKVQNNKNNIYLTVLQRLTRTVKYGTFLFSIVQYHVQNVAASTISPNADMKKYNQYEPNMIKMYK